MGKKAEIEKNALLLIMNRGIKDVSINDIISSANITKGCFYHYFSSKNQLFSDVFEEYIKSYYEDMFFKTRSSALSPRERLCLLVAGIMEYEEFLRERLMDDSISFSDFYRILIEGSSRYPYIFEFRKNLLENTRKIILDILKELEKDGRVQDSVEANIFAFKIITMNEGLIALKTIEPDLDLKDAAVKNAGEMFDSFMEK